METSDRTTRFVVVGVSPGQPTTVVTTAAAFAERFDAHLVCASVDTGRYTVVREPDGQILSAAIDPDLADEGVEEFDPELRAALEKSLHGRTVRWAVRALAGAPSLELSRLADELDATMIVVGTREPGARGSLHDFFTGSVAVQLAHRQHGPVVVVPLHPVGPEAPLPWQDAR